MKIFLLRVGQKVKQEYNTQIMEIIGFDPEFIENVITKWEDDLGNIYIGRFMQDELKVIIDDNR